MTTRSVRGPDRTAPLPYIADAAALTAYDPQFRDDPHAILDRLRQDEPAHQDRFFDRVILTRAADIHDLLADRTLSNDPRTSRASSYSRLQLNVDETFRPTMIHMDDPEHKRLRGLVARAFAQRSIAALQPEIEVAVDALLDAIDPAAPFDVVEALAKPLPLKIITRILGVDAQDEAQFVALSDAQALLFNPFRTPAETEALKAAEAGLRCYFETVIAKRRRCRRPDLVSELIAAEEDGDRLDEAEIVDVCRILLVAGNLTTRDLIGNAVVALLTHAGERDRLRSDPALIADAIEEVLRHDPPVVQAVRQATQDRTVAGCPIAAGQTVVAMIAAAGRDPALHDDPHAFRIDRPSHRHWAFGGGAHFCLGAALAQAEGQIAVSRLLARFPKLTLNPTRPPRRKAMPTLNGFEAVWVTA